MGGGAKETEGGREIRWREGNVRGGEMEVENCKIVGEKRRERSKKKGEGVTLKIGRRRGRKKELEERRKSHAEDRET